MKIRGVRLGTSAELGEATIGVVRQSVQLRKYSPVASRGCDLRYQEEADLEGMVFGEGPEREAAARRIADARLSGRIAVKGYSSQLADWMAHAVVCVSVNYHDVHPKVVMEAVAASCVLELSNITVHRELFDGISVSLVSADSSSRITEVVLDSYKALAAPTNVLSCGPLIKLILPLQ